MQINSLNTENISKANIQKNVSKTKDSEFENMLTQTQRSFAEELNLSGVQSFDDAKNGGMWASTQLLLLGLKIYGSENPIASFEKITQLYKNSSVSGKIELLHKCTDLVFSDFYPDYKSYTLDERQKTAQGIQEHISWLLQTQNETA